jgi:hypothetical protein
MKLRILSENSQLTPVDKLREELEAEFPELSKL